MLDPLPTSLVKACLFSLLPLITAIIHSSLTTGTVPAQFKTAIITPTLKKPGLDPNNFNNLRPISNLPFNSKILEKTVATQLHSHLTQNNLYEQFQSGFRPLHSTESTLIKMKNYLLLAADSGCLSLLILLDLSAAFDTISHSILLNRLASIGITRTLLSWFKSYLSGRTQFIKLLLVCPRALSWGPSCSSYTSSPLVTFFVNTTSLFTVMRMTPSSISPANQTLLSHPTPLQTALMK